MDAISATIIAGRWAQFRQHTEASINNFISINVLNLLNHFNGGIATNMLKAAHPLGGVGSSNPRRWRGEHLHHHGDNVW